MTILTKKEMTEEDIKLQYITPAILAKAELLWKQKLLMVRFV